MSKQLHIQQYGGVLEATYRWRSPKAYFLAFFCLLWDGFLVVWYSVALSGNDSMALLFPIIHVAVGLGLTYYTLCLLFNTSLIRVDRERLVIKHRPIPWWGGNWDIPVRDIKQLFVKQHRRSNKGRVSYSYGIRIVKKDGQAATLFNVFTPNSEDMRRLELAIEEQLRITDQPMEGEYRPDEASESTPLVAPRPIDPPANPHRPQLEHARRDDFITLRDQDYAVVHHIQYDWNNGKSDLLLQLTGTGGPLSLYLEEHTADYQAFETRQLEAAEQARFPLTPEAPTPEFNNGDDTYRLATHLAGYFFPDHLRHRGGIAIEQWIYRTPAGTTRFRYVHYQGMSELYIEEALPEAAIGPVLTAS
jgi:hypothetical protein